MQSKLLQAKIQIICRHFAGYFVQNTWSARSFRLLPSAYVETKSSKSIWGSDLYVCMYVCICVCMYVCMYICIYVCVYVCMYICMYVYIYLCMYVCIFLIKHAPLPM